MKKYNCPRVAAFLTWLAATTAFACQVPVFRYALEQWASDKYEIIILHDRPLSSADQSRLDAISVQSSTSGKVANFSIQTTRTTDFQDDRLSSLWSEHGKSGDPIVAVLYPRQAQEVPDRLVQVVPLSENPMEHLIHSPVRKEIAKRLLGGESAVWIFVPCGDEKQDTVALKTLTEQIQIEQKRLELPEPDDDVPIEATHIELRIAFSIVTVNREDDQETFVLNSLLRSEPDLESLQQPMAFPVFGRGRVLYGLVGKGICADTIAMASRFIVGPCSCQVKDLNPGFDLLLNVDWESELRGSKLSKTLPSTPSKPVLLTIPPGRKR